VGGVECELRQWPKKKEGGKFRKRGRTAGENRSTETGKLICQKSFFRGGEAKKSRDQVREENDLS